MKHEVLKTFSDKDTGDLHVAGSFYESSDHERVLYLENKGYLKSNEKAATLKKEKPKRITRKKASE